MTDIKSMNLEELTAYITSLGQKGYRAKQLYAWMHQKSASSFEEMTDLSADLRERLTATADLTVLRIAAMQESAADGTRKYLFELSDGNCIESVFMRYHHGNSVCISSQAGCRMGCSFCASTIDGLSRNLTPGEMLDQIYRIGQDTGERVSNVVVMGTGEPLDNIDALIRFLHLLTNESGLHISARNITVSTCGLTEGIRRLADEKLPVTLALSLHAADQKKREKLMPVAKRYSLPEVLDACRYYAKTTGRRVTFEYSLIRGVNDSDEDAKRLSALAVSLHSHINLIPVNPVAERSFFSPSAAAVASFKNKLEKNHINVTIRREMGRDIDGACGQLRKRYAARKE